MNWRVLRLEASNPTNWKAKARAQSVVSHRNNLGGTNPLESDASDSNRDWGLNWMFGMMLGIKANRKKTSSDGHGLPEAVMRDFTENRRVGSQIIGFW